MMEKRKQGVVHICRNKTENRVEECCEDIFEEGINNSKLNKKEQLETRLEKKEYLE